MTKLTVDEICKRIHDTTIYNTNLYQVDMYMRLYSHLYEDYQVSFILEMYLEKFDEILKEGWERYLKQFYNY